MSSQVRCGLQELFGFRAAFDEVLDGGFGRAEAIGWFERFGCLELGAAIGNVGDDSRVDLGDITVCSTVPRMKSSAAAICSMHSAMDHLSGAGLKFHCASLSPLVAARTPFLLLSSNSRAFSLSAALASCARAVPVTANEIAAAASTLIHLRRFMWLVLSLIH